MSIALVNPFTKQPLVLAEKGLIENDELAFPFHGGAFRVVSDDNYTNNFGFQWNKFVSTQIDQYNNSEVSTKRFFITTGWDKEDLTGKNILEVGSGAGRFTQVVLKNTKANLYSVDYSNAVEANFLNNGKNERLRLFQASIYDLPFASAQFDKVFCLGVLQHTPEFEKSIEALINMVKPGGELVVDFYPIKGWWTKLQAKYLLRPFTKKMDHERLYKKIEKNVDRMIGTSRFFSKMGIGKVFNRFIPICDIDGTLPKDLSYSQLRELCLLDTFDMFSPAYDNPQKIATVTEWFEKFGMTNVWGGFKKYDNYEAAIVKGIKKQNSS